MPRFLQLYDLLPEYIRRADHDQAFHTVLTTLGTPVVAGSAQTVTPASIAGVKPRLFLTIEPGLTNQEVVDVQSVSGPSFTAFFNGSHPATAVVTDAVLPPLAAIMATAQSQADLVYEDLLRLWNNYFVETCDDWVLAYIADLIGLNLIDDDPANNRREVARTMAYRRRKGTVPQLETMAHDVTGYSVRLVEFFERMQWSQCLFHFKPDDLLAIDVRNASRLARIGGAFDLSSRTADLRPSSQRQGWHNIRKLGFFFWRLRAIPLHKVEAQPAAGAPAGAYHFNVLGQPEPLFQDAPPPEHGTDKDWPRASELSVTSSISPRVFLESPAEFWGTAKGFNIYINGALSGLDALPANLCSWTAPSPPQNKIAVDVRLGRFLLPPSIPAGQTVTVDFSFGFSGAVGGGGYPRKQRLWPLGAGAAHLIHVSKTGPVNTIGAALAALAASTAPVRIVQIDDSRNYQENLALPANFETLVIQADDGQRPVLVLTNLDGAFSGPAAGIQLILSGLLITGAGVTLRIPTGVKSVLLQDCTVDPGGGRAADGVSSRPAGVSIQMEAPATEACLRLDHSIVGRLDLPEDMSCLAISDSIADGSAFPAILQTGPPCTILRSTLIGSFQCHSLEASLSIFDGLTVARFRQQGCVRFCYFAPGSLVPRRYECAPEDPPPVFVSRSFGDPGYTQLALDCQHLAVPGNCNGSAIAYGENGREMGVWSSLGSLRRLNHLRLRLTEYLPAGLVPVFVFEN